MTDGVATLLQAAEPLAQRHFHRDFTVLVPCRPQLFSGYASVVAQPSCVAATGKVVVILDLLALQGNRFACILPASIGEGVLREFVKSLTGQVLLDVDIFVGEEGTPRAAHTDLHIAAGDVVCFLPRGRRPPARASLQELCQSRHTWAASDQFPRPLQKAGICLIAGNHRYFVNRRQFPGQPPAEVAARTAGLSRNHPLLKVAHSALENVLLYGNTCKGVACVVDVPGEGSSAPGGPQHDHNICFFDVRPLGHKPVCHYQIGSIRHIHDGDRRQPLLPHMPACTAVSVMNRFC